MGGIGALWRGLSGGWWGSDRWSEPILGVTMRSVPLAIAFLLVFGLWGCPSSTTPTESLIDGDLLGDGVSSDSEPELDGLELSQKDIAEEEDVGEDVAGDVGEDSGQGGCKDGEVICINGKLATCDPSLGWLLEVCPEGTECVDGECISNECEPGASQCLDNSVQICAPSGQGWSEPMPCAEGSLCQGGICVPESCEPDSRECAGNMVIVCNEEGTGVTIIECEAGEVCFGGECIECTKNADCEDGLTCVEGSCVAPELQLSPEALPDGKVGEPYTVTFEASGGMAPYVFAFGGVAALPAGLSADAGTATLSGTPSESGVYEITVEVTDGAGGKIEAAYSFEVFPPETEIVITTGSPLPQGEEGTPYSVKLQAQGGLEPYSWGVVGGEMPEGLQLSSKGEISGTPAAHGSFTFVVKVFDNDTPVHFASKEFTINMKIAPLVIIGDQQYDLWVTKIIVLPLLTAIQGIPLPYNAQLDAKGGVKPYKWEEEPLPSYVGYLIPNGGLPTGLNLNENGKLSGSVTDPSQAVSVNVPFVGINLTGFFFTAKVRDSQSPADSASAIYLIPTVPVSF